MMKVLVTGAAVGIGAAIARVLAPGNTLMLHYHSSEAEAAALERELQPIAAGVHRVQADLMTDAGCEHLFEAVRGKFDALDVLINNSGGMIERRSIGELSWDHLVSTFALNVFSTMRLTSLCTDLLRKGTGACVVNVTSIAMRHGAPTATAYGSAKSAIDSFTRGAALELAPIRVNAVAPGIIATRFHERVTSEAKMKSFIEATPLKKAGSPGAVAHAVRFLVDNDFMTGETVDCNGGLFMR